MRARQHCLQFIPVGHSQRRYQVAPRSREAFEAQFHYTSGPIMWAAKIAALLLLYKCLSNRIPDYLCLVR